MYSDTLHHKCKESASDLARLGKIKFGQIFSLTDKKAINNTLSDKAWRTFWYSEGREKTKMYIVSVYDSAFILLDALLGNVQMYVLPENLAKSRQFSDLRNILTAVPSANTGITNLKGGYSDDEEFHQWVDEHIRRTNKRMRKLHKNLQTYLIRHGLLDSRVIVSDKPIRSPIRSPVRVAQPPPTPAPVHAPAPAPSQHVNLLNMRDLEGSIESQSDHEDEPNPDEFKSSYPAPKNAMEVAQFVENIGSTIPPAGADSPGASDNDDDDDNESGSEYGGNYDPFG